MVDSCMKVGHYGATALEESVEGNAFMFTGNYIHAIDDKGRVVLPSSIRTEFEGADSCYVAPGIDGQITINPVEDFESYLRGLYDRAEEDEDRRLVRIIAQQASKQKLDKAGRVMLPEGVRRHAGVELSTDVVVTGAVTHAEIWSVSLHSREHEVGSIEILKSRLAREARGI